MTTNTSLDDRWNMDVSEAASYLSESGFHVTEQALLTLVTSGRGPRVIWNALGNRVFAREDLDLYRQYQRDIDGYRDECDPASESDEIAHLSASAPTWLVVHEPSPDADVLKKQFSLFGCRVVGPARSGAEALKQAAAADVEAALIFMDFNIDAAIATADVLASRRIPFMLQTAISEIPGSILLRGTVLPRRTSLEDLAWAIELHMPRSLVDRMNTTNFIDWSEY
jgi:hypothetical protein